ncbi:hypothetical protein RUND412_006401 [Rhizina undulata]
MKASSLQRKRKGVSLGGAELNGSDSGSETSSPHLKTKKLRPIARTTSTSSLVHGMTRNVRSSNSEFLTPDIIMPFTFQHEKWLFFYFSRCYSQPEKWFLSYSSENFNNGGETIDWDQAREDYSAEWEFVRTADALQKKWSRMNIKFRGQA